MSTSAPRPMAFERLHFCLLFALAFHGLLIWGVGFSTPTPEIDQESLEVTLASFKSKTAPKEADFVAQANQQGSGSLDEAALPSTTEIADFQSNDIQKINPQKQRQQTAPEADPHTFVSTQAPRHAQTAHIDPIPAKQLEPASHDTWLSIDARHQEIASLEAQLRERQQKYAKRPRMRQVTAASTRQAADAAYLDAWRSKIETRGNQDYQKLGIDTLFGELRLMVAINANGTIHNIRVMHSSGYKALDDAAIRIVRMAAPFDPFPSEIRQNTDILQIIRTWRFDKGRYTTNF